MYSMGAPSLRIRRDREILDAAFAKVLWPLAAAAAAAADDDDDDDDDDDEDDA